MARVHYRRRFLKGLFTFLRIIFSYKIMGFFSLFAPPGWKERRVRKLHRQNAVLLRETALEMKGVMIKVGQFLSSRIDFLPDEYIEELSQLQDQVPPHPYSDIESRITGSFGVPPEQVFLHFDEAPIAAASLGQVHRAVLKDGREVAVKIQYPEIERIIETDIAMLRLLIRIFRGRYGRINLLVLHQEFSRTIRAELDYIQEGKNAERFKLNFKNDERIIIPSVLWDYTRPKVLTLEFVDGVKITECDTLEGEVDCREVISLLAETYAKMIFLDGFFHGDPHPGNIFVRKGPKLVLVDFGMVQAIPDSTKLELRNFANAIVERNIPGIIDALEHMGFIIEGADYEAIAAVTRSLIDKYRNIKPAELKALTVNDIMNEIENVIGIIEYIQMPNNFILLGRTIGILNGIAFRLNPDVNIIEIGKPYIKEFLRGNPEEQVNTLISRLQEKVLDLWNLPSELNEFLGKANRGELSFKLARREIQEITFQFKSLTDVMMLVILTVTTAASALFFVLIQKGPFATIAAGVSVLFGLLSAWRLMKK